YLDLVVRNVTTGPLVLPLAAASPRAPLEVGKQVHFRVFDRIPEFSKKEMYPLRDLPSTTAVTLVPPQTEWRHSVPLDTLTTDTNAHVLEWSIDGYGTSNIPWIYSFQHYVRNTGYTEDLETPLWRRLMNRATVGSRRN